MGAPDNPFQDVIEGDPLFLFDVYPMMQARYIAALGEEILAILDSNLAYKVVNGNELNAAHSKFWFWTLGAYELIRTLSQHGACFSDNCQTKVAQLKQQIAPVRIAFAKLEIPNARRKQGRTDFLDRSAFFSISHIDLETKDLAFEIGGRLIGMRALVTDFLNFKSSLRAEDVLAGLYHDSARTTRQSRSP